MACGEIPGDHPGGGKPRPQRGGPGGKTTRPGPGARKPTRGLPPSTRGPGTGARPAAQGRGPPGVPHPPPTRRQGGRAAAGWGRGAGATPQLQRPPDPGACGRPGRGAGERRARGAAGGPGPGASPDQRGAGRGQEAEEEQQARGLHGGGGSERAAGTGRTPRSPLIADDGAAAGQLTGLFAPGRSRGPGGVRGAGLPGHPRACSELPPNTPGPRPRGARPSLPDRGDPPAAACVSWAHRRPRA